MRNGLFSFCFGLVSTTEALTLLSSFDFLAPHTGWVGGRQRGGVGEEWGIRNSPGLLLLPYLDSLKPCLQRAASLPAYSQRELPLYKTGWQS